MEVSLIKLFDEEKVKKWWDKSIICDKEYFPAIFESYKQDFGTLYKGIAPTGEGKFAPLSVPNEVADFLDGNGFIFDYKVDGLYIIKMPEPEKPPVPGEPVRGMRAATVVLDESTLIPDIEINTDGLVTNADELREVLDKIAAEIKVTGDSITYTYSPYHSSSTTTTTGCPNFSNTTTTTGGTYVYGGWGN